jgi:hypothetical protein
VVVVAQLPCRLRAVVINRPQHGEPAAGAAMIMETTMQVGDWRGRRRGVRGATASADGGRRLAKAPQGRWPTARAAASVGEGVGPRGRR